MPGISTLALVELNGDIPPELNLSPLRTLAESCASVSASLAPYLEKDASVIEIKERHGFTAIKATSGVAVIYIVGHAWVDGGEARISIRSRDGSQIISAGELASLLLAPAVSANTQLILLIDTCNASALIEEVKALRAGASTCVIAASFKGESTLEYPLDRTTRFAEAVKASVKKAAGNLDAAELAIEIRSRLNRPGIMPSQAATYWISGEPIQLNAVNGTAAKNRKFSKTYLVLRSLLIGTGIFITVCAVSAFIYYRSHALVTFEVPDLKQVADSIAIEVREEEPDRNESKKIAEITFLGSGRSQFKLPASDLLVITKATYKDGGAREIRFHLNLAPGIDWSRKKVVLKWPSVDEIRSHPDMAYIGPTEWQQGSERQTRHSEAAFWIDLDPVTVHRYRPYAIKAERNGDIPYSVLLNSEHNASAIKVVGTEQVPKLMDDLNQVFNVINAGERAEAKNLSKTKKPGSDTQLSATAPCENCPAPLTIDEAQLFCKEIGKRMPTHLEWELAARGVDGRLYPWGNKFDAQRTNCVGLPDKGQPAATLQPSSKYVNGVSPFGVIDMVGNAGDWVDTRGGYERTFMGGFYVFNPEECMVFKSLPDTGEPPWRTITVRCAQDASAVGAPPQQP